MGTPALTATTAAAATAMPAVATFWVAEAPCPDHTMQLCPSNSAYRALLHSTWMSAGHAKKILLCPTRVASGCLSPRDLPAIDLLCDGYYCCCGCYCYACGGCFCCGCKCSCCGCYCYGCYCCCGCSATASVSNAAWPACGARRPHRRLMLGNALHSRLPKKNQVHSTQGFLGAG